MAQFTVLTAVAAPIAADNIDTDQIFPSRFSSKDRADGQFGNYFFGDQRFDESGAKRASSILNDERVSKAKILVAASNYACGSARPGAIYAHLDYGIEAIIAESFGPVFSTVAFKSGLLTIRLAKDAVDFIRGALIKNLGASLTIDLRSQTIVAPEGETFSFEIDYFAKKMFIEGVSEIDLTLRYRDMIEAFEARRRLALPWLHERHSGGVEPAQALD